MLHTTFNAELERRILRGTSCFNILSRSDTKKARSHTKRSYSAYVVKKIRIHSAASSLSGSVAINRE